MELDDISLAAYRKQTLQYAEAIRYEGVFELANKYRKRDGCNLRSRHVGSFNFSIRLYWDDEGEDWLIRFPIPGKSMFLDDKVLNEVALMKYIAENTNIPMPRVIAYGKAEDNPTGLGPFIIMTWVEGMPMSKILRVVKTEDDGEEHILNPDIDEKTLEILYGQMADVLLELWKLDFDRIGSLCLDEAGRPSIEGPPLTQQLNELIQTSNVNNCTPIGVYYTSVDYIFSLLEMQKIHLERQRNGVFDAEDRREKHTCRHLMRDIALNFIRSNNGPFKLFSDDLRPENVLVDKDTLQITAVIDWEFCYAAPSQFAEAIPWWLTLQKPEEVYCSPTNTEKQV